MKPTAIMVDIDGTLAHMNGRRSPFDWQAVGQDDLDEVIAELVRKYHYIKCRVLLLSGRDSVCRSETEKWLEKNNIQFTGLFMREEGDTRKDSVVKLELYEKYIKPNYQIKFVLDDRNQVVKMWREQGLKCLQVADGGF